MSLSVHTRDDPNMAPVHTPAQMDKCFIKGKNRSLYQRSYIFLGKQKTKIK